MTLGLAAELPSHMFSGLTAAGVNPAAAHLVANEPPIGSLFSAFLGYNPIKELLGPTGALQHLPAHQAAYLTSRSFFPKLIEQPFAHGLHLAFTLAAVAAGDRRGRLCPDGSALRPLRNGGPRRGGGRRRGRDGSSLTSLSRRRRSTPKRHPRALPTLGRRSLQGQAPQR